ncbi:YigZ family protein [Pseudoalteromonas sp. CnMc7-15]|uniref:YigZ family protein n=1 Tax=Pseudoalteromonas TaxID=53246 RepID=UPI00110B2EA4|nr:MULTISPECIES: YigZ family protein [Pseudoalteromonas]MCG7568017.1 YigZ family protein [Pseudoalteromonas sp. CnMc7-15]MCG7571669.1 YigZ family protein [Pseudoalteromonas sp. CNC9-20]TMO46207.1 YigZ family protein [Pseudoalteromonas ruthenica]TMO51630.1 YigZ family protein [Pseudoalteromonas ruthenica]|tara:strand:- start:2142 stop:2756 length:615 start_codon:yes stop_codon:yes gene_type:complete
MSEYSYPSEPLSYEEEIKKSTFIVHVAHTPDISAAKDFIADINRRYPDARHNCWAHVAGAPGGSHVYGFSDDGEPNGTAGKPMLNVLQGSGLGEICAVTTRYFGGIKLGTGGLVRAYGGTLNNALAQLVTQVKVPSVVLIGDSDYALQGVIEQRLQTHYQVLDIEKQYDSAIRWQICIDERQSDAAIKDIFDLSHGTVELKIKQ